MDDDGWSVASTASRLRRSLSRSLASNLNVKRSRSLSNVIENMCDVDVGAISNGILAATFWGDAGFDCLRKTVRKNHEAFRDLIAIFDERATLEFTYSKAIQKLSSRLHRVCEGSVGTIDGGWANVADSFDCEATIHSNLGSALSDDIVQPLRSIYNAQQKTIRSAESLAEKSIRRLGEARTEQHKAKRQTHGVSKELEKVERQCSEERRRAIDAKSEKQTAKLLGKRRKLAEQVIRSEKTYAESSIGAERQRSESEATIAKAVDRLEMIEQQRLAHFQTAIGRYQRKMTQFGPTLTQMYQRYMDPLDTVAAADISVDLQALAGEFRPKVVPFKTLILCDFYAEDFGQVVCPLRRRAALQRCALIIQKEIDKERKQRSSNPNSPSFIVSKVYEDCRQPPKCADENGDPEFSCSMIDYLSYTAFKLDQALNSLEKKPRRQSHPLGKYEERTTDKAGLRQTALRIPVHPSSPAVLPGTNGGRELGDGQSSQSSTSSPRHPATRRDSYIYERIGGETTDPLICNVLYDFTPEHDDELVLRAGERVVVDRQVSDDWWEGHILGTDFEGLFPTNYIELLKT